MIKLKYPLILASRSTARISMLDKVGLSFDIIRADINEENIKQELKETSPQNIAQRLAEEKALNISHQYPETLVIGSDQILVCEGTFFSKAKNKAEAQDKLKSLRGKTHQLTSAVALARGGDIVWTYQETAELTMHNFDDGFLDSYLEQAGDVLTSCVGAYAIEQHGSWLFETIDGNIFTILGMPLLPLLTELRSHHV